LAETKLPPCDTHSDASDLLKTHSITRYHCKSAVCKLECTSKTQHDLRLHFQSNSLQN